MPDERRDEDGMKSVKPRDQSRVGSPDLKIYVNGEIVPSEEATISVFDSGLNFADGVFEGGRDGRWPLRCHGVLP